MDILDVDGGDDEVYSLDMDTGDEHEELITEHGVEEQDLVLASSRGGDGEALELMEDVEMNEITPTGHETAMPPADEVEIIVEPDSEDVEDQEDTPRTQEEHRTSYADYTSNQVLVYDLPTSIFYGRNSWTLWFVLGLQSLLLTISLAGVYIPPIMLVSPLVFFVLGFIPLVIYGIVKTKQRPSLRELAELVGIGLLVLWTALIIALWAYGFAQFWVITLFLTLESFTVMGYHIIIKCKRNRKKRVFVRVATKSTTETVFYRDTEHEEIYIEDENYYDDDDVEDEEEGYVISTPTRSVPEEQKQKKKGKPRAW